MIDLVKNFSISARRMKKSVIRELLKLTHRPDIISFAGGLPDPATFPEAEIKDIVDDVLTRHPHTSLQYGPTEGIPALRQEIARWMTRSGAKVEVENILVTTASQQGLDLVAKIFIDPSDPVIVELPSYVGGLQAFSAYGARMIGVPTDDDGIIVDLLEKKLEMLQHEMEHYKFIYLVPDFQNPAGVTLSPERRQKVIEMGDKYNVLIIEDTPYRELRYSGEDPPSLYGLCDSGNVISLHTFSKILTPGLRVGWVVAHPDIIHKLTVAKQATDLCTASLPQDIAAEFLRRDLMEDHIEKIKEIYLKKRDCMLNALDEFMPKHPQLRWTRPDGGLFLWLTVPEWVDCEEMFFDAVEHNVAYVVGNAFHCDGGGANTMRLNFSYPSEEQIREGIKRLAGVLKAHIKNKQPTEDEVDYIV
ncbi:MAG: PLP-dependent aminotransferase family protein [Chloroflexi bacterium]|nr:PLP-dependent aminotransferase family protein [Chloroflexota bacterium]